MVFVFDCLTQIDDAPAYSSKLLPIDFKAISVSAVATVLSQGALIAAVSLS